MYRLIEVVKERGLYMQLTRDGFGGAPHRRGHRATGQRGEQCFEV